MDYRACLVAFVALLVPSVVCAQGRLQQIRQEVNNPPRTSAAQPDDDEDDDEDNNILGAILSGLLEVAFSRDEGAEGETPAPRRPRPRFLLYPYLAGYPGYMAPRQWSTKEEYELWGDKLYIKPWLVRLSVEDGNDFRDVNRAGTTLLVDSVTRWGILTQWHFFSERLSTGTWDQLTLGDFNLTYRLGNEDWMNFRVGVGMKTLFDNTQTSWGANFHLGTDIFFPRNVIASGTCDLGWVGDASAIHLHGQLGYIWRHWEFFGGYDYQRIGSVDIQGPLLGVRVWF